MNIFNRFGRMYAYILNGVNILKALNKADTLQRKGVVTRKFYFEGKLVFVGLTETLTLEGVGYFHITEVFYSSKSQLAVGSLVPTAHTYRLNPDKFEA